MCWYSRHATLSTRNSIEGEELVVRDFPNLYHRWLVSPREPKTPVCLEDGCKLRLNDIPERLQGRLQVGSEAVAEFHEIYQPPIQSLFERILPRTFHYDVLVFPQVAIHRRQRRRAKHPRHRDEAPFMELVNLFRAQHRTDSSRLFQAAAPDRSPPGGSNPVRRSSPRVGVSPKYRARKLVGGATTGSQLVYEGSSPGAERRGTSCGWTAVTST